MGVKYRVDIPLSMIGRCRPEYEGWEMRLCLPYEKALCQVGAFEPAHGALLRGLNDFTAATRDARMHLLSIDMEVASPVPRTTAPYEYNVNEPLHGGSGRTYYPAIFQKFGFSVTKMEHKSREFSLTTGTTVMLQMVATRGVAADPQPDASKAMREQESQAEHAVTSIVRDGAGTLLSGLTSNTPGYVGTVNPSAQTPATAPNIGASTTVTGGTMSPGTTSQTVNTQPGVSESSVAALLAALGAMTDNDRQLMLKTLAQGPGSAGEGGTVATSGTDSRGGTHGAGGTHHSDF